MIKREPRNRHERELYERMVEEGWEAVKKGWPDFMFVRGEDMCVVEVKPKRSYKLKREQIFVMRQLAKFGVKCFRWDPVKGFESITPMSDRV